MTTETEEEILRLFERLWDDGKIVCSKELLPIMAQGAYITIKLVITSYNIGFDE